MNFIKLALVSLMLVTGAVAFGKLKIVAFKKPHGGFIGIKYRKPKLLGLKHGGGFGHSGFGHGGFGHGGFGHSGFGHGGFGSSYGYEHHESHHESHYSSGGGGGFLGGKLGWLGK